MMATCAVFRIVVTAHVLIGVALCQGLVMSQCVAADDVTVPDSVKQVLSQVELLTTMSLKYTSRYEPGEAAMERLESSRIEYLLTPREFNLVWQNGRQYRQMVVSDSTTEFAFDGRVLAGGGFSEAGGAYRRLRKDLVEDLDGGAEYFGAVNHRFLGLYFPQGASELSRMGSLRSFVMSQLESCLNVTAVRETELDDRVMQLISVVVENPQWRLLQDLDLAKEESLLRMSAESDSWIEKHLATLERARETVDREVTYTFWLDPEYGCALRRWQETALDGSLLMQADCTDWKHLPGHQIWLPGRCAIQQFTFPEDYSGEVFEQPFLTLHLTVSELDTSPVSDDVFTLNYNVPGALITDATLPEAKQAGEPVTYTVPADLNDLDRTIERARVSLVTAPDGIDITSIDDSRQGDSRAALIWANVFAAVVMVLFLIYRRRSRSAP